MRLRVSPPRSLSEIFRRFNSLSLVPPNERNRERSGWAICIFQRADFLTQIVSLPRRCSSASLRYIVLLDKGLRWAKCSIYLDPSLNTEEYSGRRRRSDRTDAKNLTESVSVRLRGLVFSPFPEGRSLKMMATQRRGGKMHLGSSPTLCGRLRSTLDIRPFFLADGSMTYKL